MDINNTIKTLSSLRKTMKINRSQSTNNFVLLNKNRDIEQNCQWQQVNLKARKSLLERQNSTHNNFISYSQKKIILKNLQNQRSNYQKDSEITMQTFFKSKIDLQQKNNANKLNQKRFSLNNRKSQIQKIINVNIKMNKFRSTVNQLNSQRQNIIQRKIQTSQNNKNKKQDYQKLEEKIYKASLRNKRVFVVFSVRRYGLRIRLNNCYISLCICCNKKHNGHKLQTNIQLNQVIKEMIPTLQNVGQTRKVYYFNINKEPLFTTQQINQNQLSIIVSTSPKLQIDSQFYLKLVDQNQKIQNNIKKIEQKLRINYQKLKNNQIMNQKISVFKSKRKQILENNNKSDQQSQPQYDWKNIKDVQKYVQKICLNPQIATQRKQKLISPVKRQINQWYNEKLVQNQQINKKQLKNPLLQSKNHYPNETKNKALLQKISSKIQQYNFINNRHIIKASLNAFQQAKLQRKIQQQKYIQQKTNPLKRNIQNTSQNKKAIINKLDQKHSLLFEQNIPYMMNKYGINRYQIHNLFSLYKALEKVSGMRLRPDHNKVLKKGIDKNTFDQGMKRLDINPGDQVIKNICFFDDFINWEQFIKIISIGLRKTPQEKLQAILSGVIALNKGFFTKKHIQIMIGSSLSKIFDSQQPQLKEYFTQVAMKELDSDKSGTIQVSQLKNKILSTDPQNPDLVTFLLLNS